MGVGQLPITGTIYLSMSFKYTIANLLTLHVRTENKLCIFLDNSPLQPDINIQPTGWATLLCVQDLSRPRAGRKNAAGTVLR